MSISMIFFISILQILTYWLGIRVLFRERARNIWLGTIILFLCIGVYYLLQLEVSILLYIHISVILIVFVIVEGIFLEKIRTTIKAVFIIASSEEAIEAVISFIALKLWDVSVNPVLEIISANMILLSIWLWIGMIRKRGIAIQRKYINALIMLTMGIMAVALVFVIACVNYAKPFVNSTRFSTISDILAILSYLGIIILGLFIIYVNNANENYKHLLDTENLLRKTQKINYDMMLAKEEETREFRHDINNHIICLKDLIVSGNYEEANLYIDQMQMAIRHIQKKNHTTGNIIIDAILNYYIQQLKDNIEVSVYGICNADLDINHVDLCSIISNPLQNAVEALNNQKQEVKYLHIKMNATQQNFKMELCNSIDSDEIIMINRLPGTNKRDKKNHGLGLKNVMKLIEKYHGLFDVEVINREFRVTLVLPISK